MKFNQLKIGQRFRYQDTGYTKTGPLQALADGAANPRLIMRSASVQPLDPDGKETPSPAQDSDRLRQAVDRYHSECKALLTDPGADILGQLDSLYQELQQALEATGTVATSKGDVGKVSEKGGFS